MIQFDFDQIPNDATSNQMRAMQSICNVVKTSHPILIFGCNGDIRRGIAHQIANQSMYRSSEVTYFDCGIEYGNVPLIAGTIIIDNIDYASEFVQDRLQDYMHEQRIRRGRKSHMRFIFLCETNLVKRVEAGYLLPGVFYNMVLSINADHVLM